MLEHLWLRDGPAAPDYAFYKGLIQLAGAYVHLRKQFENPTHVKHGRRLRPAVRLFALASANLAAYEPRHLGLDVAAARALCAQQAAAIAETGFTPQPLVAGVCSSSVARRFLSARLHGQKLFGEVFWASSE